MQFEFLQTSQFAGSTPDVDSGLLARFTAVFFEGLFWLFVVLLGLTPVWLGSNRLIAWGANAITFGALVIAFEGYMLLTRQRRPIEPRYLLVPILAVAAVVLWVLIQNATFVPASWKHPIWTTASDILGRSIPGSISVNRDLTLLALMRLLTGCCVFWVSFQLCRNERRAVAMVMTVAILGAVYSLYGILAMLVTPNAMLWFQKTAYRGFVTSTFVNRNSFATFAGIGLLASIGVAVRLFRRGLDATEANWRLTIAGVIELLGGRGALLLVMIFTTTLALLLTGSRAGITSAAFGIFIQVTLFMAKIERRRSLQIGTLAGACLVVLVAFVGYGDVFVGRLDNAMQDAEGRLAVYQATMASISDAPVLGFGLGTFQDVFPMYRDSTIGVWGHWDKAHNTYLELIQGLGLIFGPLLILAVGSLVWRCIAACVTRQRASTVLVVAVSTSALLGAHSLVDFSAQIQAVALLWLALLGAGVAQSWSSRRDLRIV